MSSAAGPAQNRPPPFLPNWPARIAWIALAAYAFYAASILDVTWERFVLGLENGAKFIGRMLPPDTEAEKMTLMIRGLYESLEIAILSSTLGILLSLPVGLLAARNLMPPWVTWPTRLFIALCRAFHQVIVAIIFVKAVGFGALAGILALTVASIGFIAKLFADAIEEISLKQVEAIRATGAPFMNVIAYGVMPQVLTRFVGFATYQVDSNLRNSTMVGIVGAGGIGGTMFAAFQKFDYDFLLTILLAIIAMIMVSEALQNRIKRLYQ
ncbi:MAG: phosphonate ABC transporter, permease protein PhnE [Betaproteobacteria bacterium]|nr:phosphonate ABC transporter, permease protein PhnE [Betaproteobacteria bacterium]